MYNVDSVPLDSTNGTSLWRIGDRMLRLNGTRDQAIGLELVLLELVDESLALWSMGDRIYASLGHGIWGTTASSY